MLINLQASLYINIIILILYINIIIINHMQIAFRLESVQMRY